MKSDNFINSPPVVKPPRGAPLPPKYYTNITNSYTYEPTANHQKYAFFHLLNKTPKTVDRPELTC